MITSAIVLSKDSMTKRFKPRCLCYWLVDSLYFKNWLKGNQKLRKTKIHCELIIPYEIIFIDKTWDWGLRKMCLKKLHSGPSWEASEFFSPGFSKWTSDCLWAMARNRFLQQGSQDNWYFSIYMFTSIFILKIFSSYINPVY